MKLVRTALAALAAAAFFLAACGQSSSAAPTLDPQQYASLVGDAARGQDKFAGTCAACHGPEAAGLAGLGKDLTASVFVQGRSDAELIAFVVRGRSATDPANTTGVEMPARGGNAALSDQDIADIVAYIRTLQK